MTWKDKTCEKCKYRVGDKCKRFPPSLRGIVIHGENVDYPVARMYDLACAEYTEEGNVSIASTATAGGLCICPRCGGRGELHDGLVDGIDHWDKCTKCDGKGLV